MSCAFSFIISRHTAIERYVEKVSNSSITIELLEKRRAKEVGCSPPVKYYVYRILLEMTIATPAANPDLATSILFNVFGTSDRGFVITKPSTIIPLTT
jgi:hypothetical protein